MSERKYIVVYWINGTWAVNEYSDLDEAEAAAEDERGVLIGKHDRPHRFLVDNYCRRNNRSRGNL